MRSELTARVPLLLRHGLTPRGLQAQGPWRGRARLHRLLGGLQVRRTEGPLALVTVASIEEEG